MKCSDCGELMSSDGYGYQCKSCHDKLIKIDPKKEKGILKFTYLTLSKCPKCGAGIERYTKSSYSKWDEDVHFTCGYWIQCKTPLYMKEIAKCKNSKAFKKQRDKQLKELESVRNFIKNNITDEKLLKELNIKTDLKYSIEKWWN